MTPVRRSGMRHLRLVNMSGEAMDMTLKVAFASSDRRCVNQHFGAARAFVIYAVREDRSELIEVAQFHEVPMDGHEGKLAAKIALLSGCAAVFCQAVGASAIQQLMAIGVQPVKVFEGTRIENLIGSLQQQLREGPPRWLVKALRSQGRSDEARFAAMEQEGWQE